MASSRTPPPADPLAAIRERVAGVLAAAPVVPGQRLLLGYSGGLDSTVLLHALASLRGRFSFALQVHHVHHGLSPNADAWAAHCEQVCMSLEVPLRVVRVNVEPANGEGVEAAARRMRHAAWADAFADWWVTAHHRDDQAETLLFRLCRGAGVDGAAAMAPIERLPDRPGRLRPLLGCGRAELLSAATAAKLAWVEDESNADPRFSRNFLRHEVMPVLRTRFPAVDVAFARAATHFGEAAELLDALAQIDAGACGERPMSAAALRVLAPARQANLLRWQLRRMDLTMPDETRLTEALRQLNTCDPARPLSLALGSAVLQVYRDQAWLTPPLPALPPAPAPWAPDQSLAWGEGCIEACDTVGEGLARSALADAVCHMRLRWPGCRLALPGRPGKEVRQLGQELGLPPALRDRLPILVVDGRVAWMAGVGVAAGFACPPGEAGVALHWVLPARYSASGEAAL